MLAGSLLVAVADAAESEAPHSLSVVPAEVALNGSRARQQLLVSGAVTNADRVINGVCGRNIKLERVAAERGSTGRNTWIECVHHILVCAYDVPPLPQLWHP